MKRNWKNNLNNVFSLTPNIAVGNPKKITSEVVYILLLHNSWKSECFTLSTHPRSDSHASHTQRPPGATGSLVEERSSGSPGQPSPAPALCDDLTFILRTTQRTRREVSPAPGASVVGTKRKEALGHAASSRAWGHHDPQKQSGPEDSSRLTPQV